jgi:hypothetical protein
MKWYNRTVAGIGIVCVAVLMLGTDHLTSRGDYGFFLKKIFRFPMLLKKYSDFGGERKI